VRSLSICISHAQFAGVGIFVPKPSTCADCQRCGTPDLGTTIRRRPLASTAGGGDRYSLGYSVAPEAKYWPRLLPPGVGSQANTTR
jgi:hypothetical protein